MNIDKLCIFCGSCGPFNSVEHIIPEGLGNKDLILENKVCDKCNNYFGSKIESFILKSSPIGFWKTYLRIDGKKRKLPTFQTACGTNKGRLPKDHSFNDDFSVICEKDGTTSILISDKDISKVADGTKTSFHIVFTPHMVSMIGRFLLKVGLEYLCYKDIETTAQKYDKAKNYARYGKDHDLWPIFHFTSGNIQDLITRFEKNNELFEEVFYYHLDLVKHLDYEIITLKVGTDVFAVCLNEQYPPPDIASHFPKDFKPIWYHPDSF